MKEQKFVILGVAAAALVLLVLVKKNGGIAGAAAAVGEEAGAAVVNAAAGAVAGATYAIGDAVGIPRTNETECEKAIREGRYWDASFACPAGTFIGSAASDAASSVKNWWDSW